jgi:DNA polymerase III alpha subunit
MENRYLDKQFFNDFQSYQDCVPPGVRLPEIKIDESYYKKFDINSEKTTNSDFLRLICNKGLKDKEIYSKNNYKSYQNRLDYELNIIDDLGFTDYILLNWDILNFCQEDLQKGHSQFCYELRCN